MKSKTLRDTVGWLREHDDDNDRFLHGYDEGHPMDDEGEMAKNHLHRMKEMAQMISEMLDDDTQLPAWVQDHISVAHENLQQVFSYLEPEGHFDDEEDEDEEGYGYNELSSEEEDEDDEE